MSDGEVKKPKTRAFNARVIALIKNGKINTSNIRVNTIVEAGKLPPYDGSDKASIANQGKLRSEESEEQNALQNGKKFQTEQNERKYKSALRQSASSSSLSSDRVSAQPLPTKTPKKPTKQEQKRTFVTEALRKFNEAEQVRISREMAEARTNPDYKAKSQDEKEQEKRRLQEERKGVKTQAEANFEDKYKTQLSEGIQTSLNHLKPSSNQLRTQQLIRAQAEKDKAERAAAAARTAEETATAAEAAAHAESNRAFAALQQANESKKANPQKAYNSAVQTQRDAEAAAQAASRKTLQAARKAQETAAILEGLQREAAAARAALATNPTAAAAAAAASKGGHRHSHKHSYKRVHQSRRSNHRRSNRKRGGASITPASVTYRTVSANPQPSERVMQWATTAGAPMPSAAEMRGVARGGKRRTRRRCHCKPLCHCKGKCHCKPHCYCKCHTRCRHKSRRH